MRLAARTGEASPLGVLRELSDFPALITLRMRELLSEEMSKTDGIIRESCLELSDGDEMLFHG